MATVFIEDLKVDTVIGLCEWEKHVKQTLHFDIDMQVDISGASSGDNIDG
ncbi:MAG TPA: dihydroneopterin aldolase, partial [Cellvibrionales bacterium]|nr:dihydroneopterin aldolase [Cellvibrionales bacterium]